MILLSSLLDWSFRFTARIRHAVLASTPTFSSYDPSFGSSTRSRPAPWRHTGFVGARSIRRGWNVDTRLRMPADTVIVPSSGHHLSKRLELMQARRGESAL